MLTASALWIFAAALAAYLLGSVPSAVWTGKLFFNKDVRDFGSGNAGATNTFRVLGKTAGTFVLLLDVAKGFGAAYLGVLLAREGFTNEARLPEMELGLGLCAVFGHVFPVFAGFRGGKGVATLLGMVLCVHPAAALSSFGIFVVLFAASGYVSLGSLTAAASFPLLLLFVFRPFQPVLITFGLIMFAALSYTHRANINRLLHGTESRFNLWKRKK